MKIKVLLVEDHNIIRTSLRALLKCQSDVEVVGEAANGADAIEICSQLLPDVVIMDVVLRGSKLSGIQATRRIVEMTDDIKVIALSMMEDLAYIKSMLSAGASAYLFKGCTEDELWEAIQTVLQGRLFFSEGVKRVIQEDYVEMLQNPLRSRKGGLSDRELEVLRFTALGESAKEIAHRLTISRKTVDTHRRKIMDKLQLWNVADLTKYALREGIIQDDE